MSTYLHLNIKARNEDVALNVIRDLLEVLRGKLYLGCCGSYIVEKDSEDFTRLIFFEPFYEYKEFEKEKLLKVRAHAEIPYNLLEFKNNKISVFEKIKDYIFKKVDIEIMDSHEIKTFENVKVTLSEKVYNWIALDYHSIQYILDEYQSENKCIQINFDPFERESFPILKKIVQNLIKKYDIHIFEKTHEFEDWCKINFLEILLDKEKNILYSKGKLYILNARNLEQFKGILKHFNKHSSFLIKFSRPSEKTYKEIIDIEKISDIKFDDLLKFVIDSKEVDATSLALVSLDLEKININNPEDLECHISYHPTDYFQVGVYKKTNTPADEYVFYIYESKNNEVSKGSDVLTEAIKRVSVNMIKVE